MSLTVLIFIYTKCPSNETLVNTILVCALFAVIKAIFSDANWLGMIMNYIFK